MAHYAVLNEKNIVTEVFVGKDEGAVDWEIYYARVMSISPDRVKRTSYNSRQGTHLKNGRPFRKNYAAIGYHYIPELDIFVEPKPFDSWIFNFTTEIWEAPITKPDDDQAYVWNENVKNWVLYVPPTQ